MNAPLRTPSVPLAHYVFTVDVRMRARRMQVETGRRNGGEVEIVSGIDQSSRVVMSGGAYRFGEELMGLCH